jgi:nucleoside-diphosphate-sugar epimerase
MDILITGGAGFVGSNLAMHLRQAIPDAAIVCMDNLYRRGSELNVARLRDAGVSFHWGDIRDLAAFPAGPFDYLIECSAEPSVLAGQDGNPAYLFQTNLTGAFHCLEMARKWNSRFLFLSTSRVYPIATLVLRLRQADSSKTWFPPFVWKIKAVSFGSLRGTKVGFRYVVNVAVRFHLSRFQQQPRPA